MDGLLLAARVLPRSSSAWRDWRNWPTVRDRGRPCATSACLAGWPAPLSSLLPLVELGVALALLPAVSAWWSALGALGLLLVFVVGIGVSLLRGRRPACHCFGQLHSAPVGWPTLARNGALAGVSGVAGVVVVNGPAGVGPSAVAWVGELTPSELAVLVGGLVAAGPADRPERSAAAQAGHPGGAAWGGSCRTRSCPDPRAGSRAARGQRGSGLQPAWAVRRNPHPRGAARGARRPGPAAWRCQSWRSRASSPRRRCGRARR